MVGPILSPPFRRLKKVSENSWISLTVALPYRLAYVQEFLLRCLPLESLSRCILCAITSYVRAHPWKASVREEPSSSLRIAKRPIIASLIFLRHLVHGICGRLPGLKFPRPKQRPPRIIEWQTPGGTAREGHHQHPVAVMNVGMRRALRCILQPANHLFICLGGSHAASPLA